MGNIWAVEASNSQELKELKTCSCQEGTEIIKDLIDEVIKKCSDIKHFEKTDDFKKYGLYPGQQICYGRALFASDSFTHCAIYLYEGLILEAGSAPEACISEIGMFQTYFGLNTLKDFKKFGKETRKSKSWKVITPHDNSKKSILERLERAKKTVGFQRFTVIYPNCVQITNYVTFGSKRYTYPKNTILEII